MKNKFSYAFFVERMLEVDNILNKLVEKFNLGGFGICNFSDVSEYLIKCRAIDKIPNNAKSIISFIFPYYVDIGTHNISRYAVVKDYHVVVMEILNQICLKLKQKYEKFTFVPFSDNSPIPEVRAAVLSGLGVLGENNLLINSKYGSWVFIGEIVTDMLIEHGKTELKRCKLCGACKSKCPSGALYGQNFKKDICISCVSQKKKLTGQYDEYLIKSSSLVWGCDVCQEICPINMNAQSTKILEFINSVHENVSIGDYDLLDNRAYQWRPKDVIERNIKLQVDKLKV